jgi:ketosteroid isomerase-like protein
MNAIPAAQTFLRDFENLDWDRFRQSFADDATVFFPVPEPPRRFSGRAEIERQFRRVFAAIRANSTSAAAPFHRLSPVGLHCSPISTDAALVSFTLENEQRVGRRTLIWRRIGNRWRITHLHASNVDR